MSSVNHQNTKLVEAIPPANYSGSAANGNYVSLKAYEHCTIVIQTGAWAAGTAAVTINKATDVSATNAEAMSFAYMYTNDGAATTDTLVKTTVTANTFNLDTANAMYVIEIDPADLGLNGTSGLPNDCISLRVASPGANNDYYNALYILSGCRYAQGESPTPSALLD